MSTSISKPPIFLACVTALTVSSLVSSVVWSREKTDVVHLTNGDRITGEIKQLDLGVLTLKTDHAGTVSVEWVGIEMIESTQLFEVTETNGDRLLGRIGPSNDGTEFEIEGFGRESLLGHEDIVRIAQMEEGWWRRWRGYVDLGAELASANNQTDLTLDAEARYRSERFDLTTTLFLSAKDRDAAARTSRGDLISSYKRFLRRRWFWYGQVQVTRNEELDLDRRLTVSGGAGRFLLQTTRSQLSLGAGLSALRENYYDEPPGEWSSEAVLSSRYELFLFEGRETSITADLSLLPSLTVSGRYRVELYSSFRRKLVRDFTLALTLEESYDSKPPEAALGSDTRLRTTLGWSF